MSLKLKFIILKLVICSLKIPIENFRALYLILYNLFILNNLTLYLYSVSIFIISPAFPDVSNPPMLYDGQPKPS